MNSMTVTSLPKAEKADANSIPITPAPMMVRRLGSFGIESSSVEVTMFCAVSSCFKKSSSVMKGGIFEREPVAMMIYSASICSPFTSTTWSETKRASPFINVIPGWLNNASTPSRS